jgi:hypothetical protein
MPSYWSTKKAFFYLIGSTCLTLTLSVGGFFVYRNWKIKRMTDEKCRITAIMQTGPEKEALKTSYLAELLDLSVDSPSQLYAFNLNKAIEKLLQSPLIAQAEVKRIPPGTLYIDYSVRKPIALLADYANTAIDKEGYIFPIAPFFSPKQFAEIYLGLPSFGSEEDGMGRRGGQWKTPLQNVYLSLAFDLLKFLEAFSGQDGVRIKRIDVSNAFAPSLGQREIVLIAEDELVCQGGHKELICLFPTILRLAPKDYQTQLNHFFSLRHNMLEDYKRQLFFTKEGGRFASRIIDLRIPQLAFIDNTTSQK